MIFLIICAVVAAVCSGLFVKKFIFESSAPTAIKVTRWATLAVFWGLMGYALWAKARS